MVAEFHFMHAYPLFDGLGEGQMAALTAICHEECFLPGSVLFTEGEPARELFVLVDGRVEESFAIGEAEVSRLRPAAPGDLLGCPALFAPYIQNCTARTIGQTEVLAIDAPALRKLFDRDAALARTIQEHVLESLLTRICELRTAGLETAGAAQRR